MTDDAEEDEWCCEDDWDVWLRFETWSWAVLLLLQLSMVAFVVSQGRKDRSFRQAFYVFFVAVTLVDCALALLRPSREWEATVFGARYDRPYIGAEDPCTHPMKRNYPTIRHTLNDIAVHAFVPILGHAQPLFLTAIAATRFTAFAFPLKHASMWRTQTTVLVTISITVASVFLGAAYPVTVAIHQAVKCSRSTRKQRVELCCNYDTWAFQQVFIPTTLITLTSAICCVVSFFLNVGSISMLVALRTSAKLQRKGPELQLFAHSLWMFLLQLFLTFGDIIYFADNREMISLDLEIWDLEFPWKNFRHSSEWMAGVNATRNWAHGDLDFTPGCAAWTGYFYDDKELPICNMWYLLLIGELRLRELPDFTVRTLEWCLFALSGSVFLLIISGNVRDAYFNFYFKWQCLMKKRWHRRGGKIIKVTARRAPSAFATTTPTISALSLP